MLERASGCLKAGGQHLLRSAPNPLRTRRCLHSSFWCHGAGDIDLPSWWISLLQQPPPESTARLQSIADTAKRCLSAGLLEGGFLDFLYPTKTITLIHKLAVRDANLPRTRTYKTIGQHAVRAYASIATDDRVATESDFDHPNNLVSAIHKNSHTMVDKGPDVGQVEILQYARDSKKLALPEVAYLSVKELRQHKIDTARRDYELAWKRLSDLRVAGEGKKSEDALTTIEFWKIGRRVEKTGTRYMHSLFYSIPKHKRKKVHYNLAIRIASLCNRLGEGLRIFREACQRSKVTAEMPAILISSAVKHRKVEKGCLIYEEYRNYCRRLTRHPRRGLVTLHTRYVSRFRLARCSRRASVKVFTIINVLTTLNQLKQSVLMNAAIRAGNDFLKYPHSIRSFHSLKLRNFAVNVIMNALDRKQRYIAIHKHFELWTMLGRLIQPNSRHFTIAMSQVLPYGDHLHVNAAIRLYESTRDLDFRLPGKKIKALIRWLIKFHKTIELRMVFGDFKRYYGVPAIRLFKKILGELSSQGDEDGFRAEFDDFRSYFGNHSSHTIYKNLLNVYFRRLEVDKVDQSFQALSAEYGFTPTIECWNTVIAAHARVSDISGALEWHQRLIESGPKPNAVTFATLMNMYAPLGDVDIIEDLVIKCEAQRLKLSTSMIDSLVIAHIKNDNVSKATRLCENALKMDLKGSRTHMWNCLLSAYALRRSYPEFHVMSRRMQDAGVHRDAETWAAILQSFCVQGRPAVAFRILTKTMPEEGIRATALHYAVIFRGFIKSKQYGKVFITAQHMVDHDIKTNFSALRLLVIAAVHLDRRARPKGEGLDVPFESPRAEALLIDGLNRIDRSELAPKEAVLGIGPQRLDEAYLSNYFGSLIESFGSQHNYPKAIEIYNRYYDTVMEDNPNAKIDPPINILTALMLTHYRHGDHAEVEYCWYLVVNKAESYARRIDSDLSKPGWVQYSRRFALNWPLGHYMRSLLATDRVEDIKPLVTELETAGYALTNSNWNIYVQCLAMSPQPQEVKAFRLCEQELMRDWAGWRRKGGYAPAIREAVKSAQPSLYQQWKRVPDYTTFVYLAGAYMTIRSRYAFKGSRNAVLEQVHNEAPKTVRAINEMPRIDDTIQLKILRST